MNYTGPKVKLSRKLSVELTPKSGKYLARKPYPPGQHGQSKRRGKQSDFGRQLIEKQRLKLQYNVSEKQLRNYYEEASQAPGNTAEILVQMLEQRLDALVYRSGLARTVYMGRQLVNHGHIEVNGKRVDIPSYRVKVNDVIALKQKTRKNPIVQDCIRSAAPPEYLDLSKAEFSARFLHVPTREEINTICDSPLVVEYYSR